MEPEQFSQLFEENEIIPVKATGDYFENNFIAGASNAIVQSPDGKVSVQVLVSDDNLAKFKKDNKFRIVYLGLRETERGTYIQVRPLFKV